MEYGHSVVGFRNGWKGVVEGQIIPLTREDVRGILPRGGTMLGTARFHPHKHDGGLEAVLSTLEAERVEALVCIGGDGTLNAANKVAEAGVKVVGIPKTIDNDVAGTDLSIGFHTAINVATDAIDRLHTTAESHNRVMIVEVRGHTVGWIAVNAGIAGGADLMLTPEDPFDIEELAAFLRRRHKSHANFSIVVVAEGAEPAPGTAMDFATPHDDKGRIVAGSIGEQLTQEIRERTGFDTRLTVLGHVQRGGTPTPTDRILGSRFGVAAIDALSSGKYNVMTAVRGEDIVLVPLKDVAGKVKQVPPELVEVARALW
jgi:6-phosphofructokinase 1